jgi:cytochrome c-type biogenesis protein CcmH/NrfF
MKHLFYTFALLLSLLVFPSDSTASIEVVEFDTASQEQRYRELIQELRCFGCASGERPERDRRKDDPAW